MQKGLDSLRPCRPYAALARFLLLFFSFSLFFFFSAVTAASAPTITIDAFTNGPNHIGGVSTASVTALVKDASGAALIGQTVTWSVVSANNATNAAVTSAYATQKTGLAWGPTHVGVNSTTGGKELTATSNSVATDSLGKTTVQISDIVGERTVTLWASVTIGGTAYTVNQAVTFGNGPLKVFKVLKTSKKSTLYNWVGVYAVCNGFVPSGADVPLSWTDADSDVYHGGGKMPTIVELQAVSSGTGEGAAYAAGWPDGNYWAGEAGGMGKASFVNLYSGNSAYLMAIASNTDVVCRR